MPYDCPISSSGIIQCKQVVNSNARSVALKRSSSLALAPAWSILPPHDSCPTTTHHYFDCSCSLRVGARITIWHSVGRGNNTEVGLSTDLDGGEVVGDRHHLRPAAVRPRRPTKTRWAIPRREERARKPGRGALPLSKFAQQLSHCAQIDRLIPWTVLGDVIVYHVCVVT